MEIIIILILILLNGLFSMSEIAVISSRKSSLNSDAKQGDNAAKNALKLANNPDTFLSTVQIGITLIGILTGLYSGASFSGKFATILINIGISEQYAYIVAQTSIIIVVTYLTIVFGELIPKKIGMNYSEKVAKLIASPMRVLAVIATPFVWILAKTTEIVGKLIGIKESDSKVTEEEIRSMILEGTEDGEVQLVEKNIVERVFSLGDRDLDSIMTHRSEIKWIDLRMSRDEILQFIQKNPFIIYPVSEKGLDESLGFVYLKELLANFDNPSFKISSIIRPALYLPENMGVYTALDMMKAKRTQYALVSNEYGGIEGIITFKNVLEGLLGDLPDEHEEPEIIERHDGSYLIDGRCPFYNFLAFFDKGHLNVSEYNTISGLVLDSLGHIPQSGEKIAWHNFSIEVVDMDGARIDKLLVIDKEKLLRADAD